MTKDEISKSFETLGSSTKGPNAILKKGLPGEPFSEYHTEEF